LVTEVIKQTDVKILSGSQKGQNGKCSIMMITNLNDIAISSAMAQLFFCGKIQQLQLPNFEK
jgi:hypothetical protein